MADAKQLPSIEDEALLKDIELNSIDYVMVRNKRYKVKWTKRGAISKMTKIVLEKDSDESKVSCKCAAAIVLGSWFKINVFWWFLWRWFYYVKEYGDHELIDLIALAKKKIPAREYLIATISLIALKDTAMQMTRAEADNILHEQPTDKAGK